MRGGLLTEPANCVEECWNFYVVVANTPRPSRTWYRGRGRPGIGEIPFFELTGDVWWKEGVEGKRSFSWSIEMKGGAIGIKGERAMCGRAIGGIVSFAVGVGATEPQRLVGRNGRWGGPKALSVSVAVWEANRDLVDEVLGYCRPC